ncbi:hypothetical protein ABIF64_000456 [Bradyrhizobium japonicum]|uniref:hypothetical protein n=1 Tax=Bradyrhizobium japonicum TaxID=375 RepID=UPI0033956E64
MAQATSRTTTSRDQFKLPVYDVAEVNGKPHVGFGNCKVGKPWKFTLMLTNGAELELTEEKALAIAELIIGLSDTFGRGRMRRAADAKRVAAR